MEPIAGTRNVDKKRETDLSCYLCHEDCGYCIQCSHEGCYLPFHPHCAGKYLLHLEAEEGDDGVF